MKRMYILVGPPGCGKSHITGMINEAVGPLAVCSADHFFEQDGVYRFNPTLLHSAHRDCQNRALKAVDQGYGTVVIDNTATRHKERKYYLALAEQYNYIPVVVSFPETGHTNIHGVPAEKVKEMRDRMDLNPGVYLWSTATGYLHAQDFDEFVLKIRESISHIARGRS
jgi:energy-coupling factor transporter ATP-binding protein EcfA2